MAEQLPLPVYENVELPPQHDETILQQFRETEGGFIRMRTVALALGAAAAGMMAHAYFFGPKKSDDDVAAGTFEVVRVEAVPIEYLAQYDTEINKASIPAKLLGLAGGFTAEASVETESLGGPTRESTEIEVDEESGHQTITIHQDTFEIFTRVREDTREVTTANARGISRIGNSIGGILDSFRLPSGWDISEKQKTELAQYLMTSVVNKVDTDCAGSVFGDSEAVIEELSLMRSPLINPAADESSTANLPESATDDAAVLDTLSRGQIAIAQVYFDQAVSRGIDPADITLRFVGVPKFQDSYQPSWNSKVFELGELNFKPNCDVASEVTSTGGSENSDPTLFVNGSRQDQAALVGMAARQAAAGLEK